VKPDKRKPPQERGRIPADAPIRDVDPDQPFPQDPSPQGPEDAPDRNLDRAYQGKEHGEGNYQAAKDYGKRVRSFVRSGQVGRAAQDAAPRDGNEARELAEAESQGRKRSKGEDPSLQKDARKRR
jgi:hypothetical protein